MAELRRYNVAATILFPLVERDAVDFLPAASFASGDVKIIKDEGSPANTSNLPTHEGNGIYSLALTATEMQAARIVVIVVDQTSPKVFEDQAVLIETYGNASAQHGFDLDKATQDVNVASMDNNVITSAKIAADAITSAQLADSAAQKIADEILRRAISNVEPGAGLRSLYGAICSLVNRVRINASGNLEVYKTNDTDILATLVATTDVSQQPITELDPS